tara:strand:- start:450 stop:968 length:519 start_codon:yes stop_codon:yes gene_type:complete
MNTKDREYLEALTGSIAKINQTQFMAFEALKRSIEETNVKLRSISEALAKMNPKLPSGGLSTGIADAVTSSGTWVPASALTVDYAGWTDEVKAGEEQEELHPMIKNNKFTDDGTLFQEEEDATPNLKPSPRKRESWKSNLVDVACSKCGKLEKVNKLHAGGSVHNCKRCTRR